MGNTIPDVVRAARAKGITSIEDVVRADPISPSNRVKMGDAGEAMGRAYLEGLGYEYVGQLKNNSGHGLDGVFRKDGKLVVADMKTSTAANFMLEPLQKKGPVAYAVQWTPLSK